ncbi:hypothetical protein ACG7TL_003730 [Trametes sanguinea]
MNLRRCLSGAALPTTPSPLLGRQNQSQADRSVANGTSPLSHTLGRISRALHHLFHDSVAHDRQDASNGPPEQSLQPSSPVVGRLIAGGSPITIRQTLVPSTTSSPANARSALIKPFAAMVDRYSPHSDQAKGSNRDQGRKVIARRRGGTPREKAERMKKGTQVTLRASVLTLALIDLRSRAFFSFAGRTASAPGLRIMALAVPSGVGPGPACPDATRTLPHRLVR